MSHETRSNFLKHLGLAGTALATGATGGTPSDSEHAFVVPPQADVGEEAMWHGYPDESYSLTSFADSLVALA